MTKNFALNNVDHKDLKVDTAPHVKYGDHVNRSRIFATEIGDLHKEYPLMIHQDNETGELELHAILGLDKDENLFLDEKGWITRFVPAILARGPFSITYRETNHEGETRREPFMCVDMDDPRVGAEHGEPVFMPMGGESAYLSYVKKALQTIETGYQYNKTLFTLLQDMELLEHVSIEVKLSNEEQVNMNNYFTVNQDKLAALDGASLQKLSQYGVLSLLYFLLSSMGNFQRLIELKNAKSLVMD